MAWFSQLDNLQEQEGGRMKRKLLASLISAAVCQPILAAEISDYVRFSGFGTLGIVHSSDKDADFRGNIEQSTGAGRTNTHDSGVDSVFGAQADVQFMPNLTGTAQIVTRRLSDYNSTRPYFEWANIKYQATRDLSVRAGRVVAPVFMISDSRMVGYAQTMVRPPEEVYFINPITYVNGADVNYKFAAGPVLYKVGATIGKLNQSLVSPAGTVNYKFDAKLINGAAEYNGSTLRLGYGRVDLTAKSELLDAYDKGMTTLVNAGVANASTVQDNTYHTDNPVDMYTLGYVYDKNEWLLQGEYVSRKSRSDIVLDLDGFSLMGGYRIAKWTPFLGYAHMNTKNPVILPSLNTSSLPPGQAGAINALNATYQMRHNRTTWSMGTRWDVIDNVALKVQFDRTDKEKGGTGLFVNSTPEFNNNDRKINVYSATLDFVF